MVDFGENLLPKLHFMMAFKMNVSDFLILIYILFQKYYVFANTSEYWTKTLSPGAISQWTLPLPADDNTAPIIATNEDDVLINFTEHQSTTFSTFGKREGRRVAMQMKDENANQNGRDGIAKDVNAPNKGNRCHPMYDSSDQVFMSVLPSRASSMQVYIPYVTKEFLYNDAQVMSECLHLYMIGYIWMLLMS